MKKNVKSIKEKMKQLERVLRETERDFYAEFGKEVEREIAAGNADGKMKEIYEKLKEKYGI
ncbi:MULTISPECIES: hypothetical protein [Thermodesulfovibrio]|jgi:hypothetical protein|uniref:hypothetical protein n=1 Tax=Thermodesulfovibrio TaxID=28261 RepID=UPI002610EDCB|nr:hypothetical protein [Thermodesulfovibrio sp.]